MRCSHASTGWRAYMKVVVSRSVLTTIVMWIHRMMLAMMQAELLPWRNIAAHNDTRIGIERVPWKASA
jgi:hypothetical protein